tara:strand:- start:514 stop:684 length:171 start_codon:yes stop_codon:yes gene_type:complete
LWSGKSNKLNKYFLENEVFDLSLKGICDDVHDHGDYGGHVKRCVQTAIFGVEITKL